MSAAAIHSGIAPARAGAPAAGFDRLDAIGVIRHLAPHEALVFEGDAADCFHRVLSGSIATYKATADGRRQVIAFFFPGDLVGLTAGASYTYGAEAVKRTSVCSVPHARFRELTRDEPTLREALLAALRREIAAAQERLLWLGRKTAQERLACFILECADRIGRPGRNGCQTVPLPMSQPDIADHLGLASETVSRALGELARDGTIEVERPFTGVVIRDRRRLERAADGGEPAG